ncbi:hypothetical protein [Nonomuraea rhodomycinica]|uniref:hypothetical protein n=1 Tax=Nonomuraea rhodomycinica TaxID=1712872 RepID=UPI001C377200|nr:hypothetical protein [Nonomuraea rhodomycinica]
MLTRRTLLTGAGAAALSAALPTGRAEALALATLPPGAPDRRLFAPAEQRFATYLTTLAPMVHDMDASGFFAGGWWRSPAAPYNARVQEHVYTLAWFLTQRRAWNPYSGDPALQSALDAALGHYLSLQHADGSFPSTPEASTGSPPPASRWATSARPSPCCARPRSCPPVSPSSPRRSTRRPPGCSTARTGRPGEAHWRTPTRPWPVSRAPP